MTRPRTDAPASRQLDITLATIRGIESGGDYAAQNAGSSASGAYQFLDTTWAGYGGYDRAWEAPAVVQDAKAIDHVQSILDNNAGDIGSVPVVWYIGHVPAAGSAEWDTIPYPSAGNVLTPRQYQTRWLAEYAEHSSDPSSTGRCLRTREDRSLRSPTATPYPGPWELFSVADVNAPHAAYPAWDWLIPEGTPIYAIRGGARDDRAVLAAQLVGHGLRHQLNQLPQLRHRRHHRRRRRHPLGLLPRLRRPRPRRPRRSPPEPNSSPAATPAAPAHPTSTSKSPPPTASSSALSRCLKRCDQPTSASVP